ncbi:MAG: DUF2301 domain-containing membrane protein [Cyanobacteria bacterium P01_A01_bin.114]
MTSAPSEIYEGQFGTFAITDSDRREVLVYRGGLAIAALCFALGSGLAFAFGKSTPALWGATGLYGLFWLALGVSLFNIHIYMRPLHVALQIFWAIGGAASLATVVANPQPLVLTVYQYPLTILGIGFTFAALTGIFFKEAFCFNRFETKFLTLLVPLLLLGHLTGILPMTVEQGMLAIWAGLFIIFALRKALQAVPPDIGDKSVFEYLAQQRAAQS